MPFNAYENVSSETSSISGNVLEFYVEEKPLNKINRKRCANSCEVNHFEQPQVKKQKPLDHKTVKNPLFDHDQLEIDQAVRGLMEDNADVKNNDKEPQLDRSEIKCGEVVFGTSIFVDQVLAEGGFGRVYSVTENDVQFALKVTSNVTELEQLDNSNEATILNCIITSEAFNSHLMTCYESFSLGSRYCFLLERLDIDLHWFIERKNSALTAGVVLNIAEQVLIASSTLIDLGFLHADIKPSNILLCNSNDKQDPWKVKLCDYGLTVSTETMATGGIQTLNYRAPEVLLGLPYCERADSWSIGCTVFFLYMACDLFDVANEFELFSAIISLAGLPKDAYSGSNYGHLTSPLVPLEQAVANVRDLSLKTFSEFVGPVDDAASKLSSVDKVTIKLMQALLKAEPSERPTSREAMDFVRKELNLLPNDQL